MTNNRQKRDEELHFQLFKKLYEQKFTKTFPPGKIEHVAFGNPDFLVKSKSSVLGIELTELFKKKSKNTLYSPREKEGFREKIINDAKKLCEEKGIPPLEVKILFKSLDHISGKNSQFELSRSIANSIEKSTKEKQDEIFHINNPELDIPEIYEISVIRGTLNGQTWLCTHRWFEILATWQNRNFVSELQTCIDAKNKKYNEYRKRCNACWLLIVTNKSKRSQAFEITDQILQYTYNSQFGCSFYMEVLFKDLYMLNTT